MKRPIHRRRFLRGAGGAVLALPMLQMFGGATRAAPGHSADGFPLRLVVFFHPNGVRPSTWWPQGTPTEYDWELAASLTPLAPHKDRLLILDGIDMPAADAGPGEDHQQGMGALLTGRPLQSGDFAGGDGSRAGWGDGISVDQAIAERIGKTTAFSSLELGVRASAFGGSEVRTRLIYSGPGAPLPPADDPVAVWHSLFSELTLTPAQRARLIGQRVSVLDTVNEQFAALAARAGAEDRVRLQQHAALVEDLQTRVGGDAVLGEACIVPPQPDALGFDAAATMPIVAQTQLDLMVHALACDLTRVASIQFSNGMNHVQFPWLGSASDGHLLSHKGDADAAAWAEWSLRERWYAEQFAYLLTRMDEIPEGGGTMLDHSVVLWVNELAKGNTHSHQRMPFVLAGDLDGHFRTGRYLTYDHAPHNDLLVSLLAAFGDDAQCFGAEEFCTGPLSGLT